MTILHRSLITLAFVGAVSNPASSQPTGAAAAPRPVVARDSGARMERLAEGVFAIFHDDAILSFPSGGTDWPHSNVGVIVGDRGVLVIDSDFFPSRAAADIALIKRVTNKPVQFLLNTHWHGDHTHGNAVYVDSFPAITIIGSRDNAQYVGVNQGRFPLSAIGKGSGTQKLLAEHETTLARGTDSTGRALTGAERALLGRVIAQRQTQLREFAAVRVAPPTLLFDQNLALDLGKRRVELVNHGHANSPSDVTAYLPTERILFTGDIVVWPVPYTFDAYPRPWARVLRDLEAVPVAAIVPGHGPLFEDHAYVRQMREMFDRVLVQADSLIRRGALRADIEKAIDLSRFKPLFVRAGDVTAEDYWEASIRNSFLERVYQCTVGSRC